MRTKLYAALAMGLLLGFVAYYHFLRKPPEPPRAGTSDTKPAIPATRTAEPSPEKARKEMVANHDAPIDDFFKANQGLPIPDALRWVKHNPQSFPGGVTLESMLNGLSNAGAQKINVISNFFCDYLIVVTLPTEPILRQKVFASDSQVREILQLEKTRDFGQKSLGVPLRGQAAPDWAVVRNQLNG